MKTEEKMDGLRELENICNALDGTWLEKTHSCIFKEITPKLRLYKELFTGSINRLTYTQTSDLLEEFRINTNVFPEEWTTKAILFSVANLDPGTMKKIRRY